MEHPLAIHASASEPVRMPVSSDLDALFESLLREAKTGKEHAQSWDTGDAVSNLLGLLLPSIVTLAFHQHPQFTFVVLNATVLTGFRFFFRSHLKDQRQLGICFILGGLLGALAWFACLRLFGPGHLGPHYSTTLTGPGAPGEQFSVR